MNSTLKFLCCQVIVALVTVQASTKDGVKEGQNRVESLWIKKYERNCDDIFVFTQDVIENLVDGSYRKRSDDSKKKRRFRKGARRGSRQTVERYQKECLDPNYCDDLGQTAAELIVANFCGTLALQSSLFHKREELVYMCRTVAKNICQGDVYDLVKSTVSNNGQCDGIDNTLDKLDNQKLIDLQDKCRNQVDDMIGFDKN